MQVSVESVSNLERRLKVAVPEEQISDAVQKKLQEMTKTVKIKGFRPGKVPMKVVAQRYGNQIRSEVIGDLVQRTYFEAVTQEKLRPAGMPNIDTTEAEEGKGLEYTATFEVYPEIKPADISGCKVEVPAADIGDKDIDQMIETIRKQQASWEKVERAAANDDRVVVDYEGTIEGESFTGGQGTDVSIELGKGRMIKGFEDGLVGAKADEERTLNLTFPEDYHAKEVAGKPVQFKVTVKRVEGAKLPEVDADFAKRMGVADGDLDKMREEVHTSMLREMSNTLKTRKKEAIMEQLLVLNDIEVPEALVANESQNLASQMANNLAAQGLNREQSTLDPSLFKEQAERRVKLGLILSELVKQNGLEADAASLREAVERIAEPYEHPEEVVKWYYGDKQRLAEIESVVLEEKLVDWALEKMEVIENKTNFHDLMNPKSDNKNS